MPQPPISSRPRPVWLYPAAWVILFILVLYFFSPISTVVLGVLAAVIIACTLQPLLDYIPAPRGIAVALVGLALIAATAAVAFSLSWPLRQPLADAAQNWPQTLKEINATLQQWSTTLALEEPMKVEKLLAGLGDFLVGTGGQQLFSRSADVLLGILVSLAFTLVGSIFLLSEPASAILTPGLRLVSAANRPAVQAVLNDLAPRYRRWVIGTLTGMCVVFTASAIGYSIIGLKMALLLALVAGFAEIVPTVGPAVACLITALFAAATQSGGMALGVLTVYAIIQAIEAYLILPLIMRGAVNMHPAVTLFTVVLWGKIFGVPGLMLAIPINLTLWTLLDHLRIRPREASENPRIPASTSDSGLRTQDSALL